MKLPNNYGSITKLSGNRRRPFMVRKSLDGKQLVIGYFETKEKALQALADYNRQPSELPKTSITLTTLYKQWLPHHAPSLSKSGVASYENSYRHIQSIAAIPIQNLTYDDFQGVLDAMQLSYASKKKVRSLINQLCKFAIKKDLMQRNFGDLVTIGKNSKIRPHKPFTRQQINKLWQLNTTESDGALILLYTGMRCGELLNLRRRDINLKSKYLKETVKYFLTEQQIKDVIEGAVGADISQLRQKFNDMFDEQELLNNGILKIKTDLSNLKQSMLTEAKVKELVDLALANIVNAEEVRY